MLSYVTVLCLSYPLYDNYLTYCDELGTLLIWLVTCYVIVILLIVPCIPNMNMIMTGRPSGSPSMFMFTIVTFGITAYLRVATYAYAYAYTYVGYMGAHDKRITTSPSRPNSGSVTEYRYSPLFYDFLR